MKNAKILLRTAFMAALCCHLVLGAMACGDKEANADAGPDAKAGGGDGDADTDADGDTDTDADGDADTDADGDADTDGDTDTDTDADGDADTETEMDAGAPKPPCSASYECAPTSMCVAAGGLLHDEMSCTKAEHSCCELVDGGADCPDPFECLAGDVCPQTLKLPSYNCKASSVCCDIESRRCDNMGGTCRLFGLLSTTPECRASEYHDSQAYCPARDRGCCTPKTESCEPDKGKCRTPLPLDLLLGCSDGEFPKEEYKCGATQVCCVKKKGCEINGGFCRSTGTILDNYGCREDEHPDNDYGGCQSVGVVILEPLLGEICCMPN